MRTKTNDLLAYLQENENGITHLEAMHKFGISRASDAVYALRKKGYPIASTTEHCVDRYGRRVSYARYKLVKENENEQC